MRQYQDNAEYSTTSRIYTPDDNTQCGAIPTEAQSNIEQWQQGFMSREEVSSEATASGAVNFNYRIPKLSEKKGL